MARGDARRKAERNSSRRAPAKQSRVLVYGLAFAFFALPLFILPEASEYGYTKTILAIVLVSALAIVWGIESWRKGAWTIRIPWIAWPSLALVAAGLFSLLGATNGRFVVQSLVLLLTFFVLLVLVLHAAREKRDMTLLLGSFLVSTSLVSLYGLLQYLGVMRGPGSGSGLEQVISTLGNKEYVAGVLAYILLPSVILLVRSRSTIWRLGIIALIAFNFGSLMLFDQAGANVALIAGAVTVVVGVFIFRPIEPLRRARLWLFALLAVVAFTYLVEAPSGPLNSVVGLSADETSWLAKVWAQNSGAVRTWDWWVGVEMWKSSPWVGVGLGNYKLNFLPFKARFLETPRGAAYDFHIARAAQAHNEYVQVLAEMGILGVLALGALLATLAASLVTRLVRNRNESDRLDLVLCAGGLAAFVVHALVSFPAHLPASSLAAILILGIALSRATGDAAARDVTLRGWGLRTAGVGVMVLGVAASVVALRDLEANVLMRNGIIQLQLGNTAQARTMLERSLHLDFAPHQTLFFLGMAQAQLGDTAAAYESFSRCQTRFLDENTYLVTAELAASLGKTDEAEEALRVLLASRPSPSMKFRALYVKAGMAVRRGDTDEARRQLESLVREAPEFEPAGMLYASVLAAGGSRDAARAEYQRILAVVERNLAAAEKSLAASAPVTAATYGELRSSIVTLRSQRDTIRERLKSLGES